MGPPRSVAMRSNSHGVGTSRPMMRPPMGSSHHRPLMGGSSMMGGGGIGMHRRGSGTMRGRISHYRPDGRRGMLPSRILGGHHRRTDMRPMTMHNRRYPSMRGRGGDMRSRIMMGGVDRTSRVIDAKISRKTLIKRALQAAKDGYEESPSDNDDDDDDEEDDEEDDDEDVVSSRVKKVQKADASVAEDDDDEDEDVIKAEKDDDWGDDEAGGDVKSSKSSARNDDHEDGSANTTGATVDEGDDDKGGAKQSSTPVKKVVKKEDAKDAADDRKASDEGSDKKRSSTKITTKYRSSNFIKLTCVHCKLKCVTFKEYQHHLYSRNHKLKMRSLAIMCRERLLEMRAAQRNAQKDVDEKSEDGGADGDDGKLVGPRAGFCMLCRLNYRQQRTVHQQSEGHRQMKKFLMPFCKVCNISFKSPMAYETHRASLDHLKIKARVERYAASSTKGEDSGEETPADAGDLVDMDSLTIVDEVGKVDEICEASVVGGAGADAPARKRGYGDVSRRAAATDDEDDEEEEEDDEEDEENDDESQMIIGAEHVKKVQVQYCDLCIMYLPRRPENQQDRVLREHCKQRPHLKQYIRFRNDKKLREQAERIQKKKLKGDKEAASGKKGDEKKANDSTASADSKAAGDETSAASSSNTTTPAVSTLKSDPDAGEKKHDVASASSTTSTKSNTADSGTGGGAASQPQAASADTSDANLSLDGSSTLATSIGGADGPGTLTDEQVDKLMWQVVDNDDLGDLLREVQEDVEEEDDDKTNLERYDKFRHTEKNGGEQKQQATGGDEEDEDVVKGKKGTAANGGGKDSAANGGEDVKPVVG
uniref:U1-type domain-containing protein n=1 Tax=Anopheles dirus TaxID=7168 RepID=A0A182NIG9_9DIPT